MSSKPRRRRGSSGGGAALARIESGALCPVSPPCEGEPASASASASAPAAPTREQIAGRAREIWARRGQPEGQDLDIWLSAEEELIGPSG